MDEAEQDTQNYSDRGQRYHSPRKIGDANTNKKQIVFKLSLKKITALLKFMRDAAEKIPGHCMDMTNTTFICQGQNLTLTNTRLILSAPKYA